MLGGEDAVSQARCAATERGMLYALSAAVNAVGSTARPFDPHALTNRDVGMEAACAQHCTV